MSFIPCAPNSLRLYLGVAEAGEQMQVQFFRISFFGNGTIWRNMCSAICFGDVFFINHPLVTKLDEEGQKHVHCHRAVVTIWKPEDVSVHASLEDHPTSVPG